MANLKIKFFELGKTNPERTITIPMAVVRIAEKFIPKEYRKFLEKESIDVRELLRRVNEENLRGILFEIEEINKHIVVAIE
jgi:hypothetical protein